MIILTFRRILLWQTIISMSHISAKIIAVTFLVAAAATGFAFRADPDNASVTIVAQQNPVYEEVIINIPGLTEKNYVVISQELEAMKGVQYRGYCRTFNIMMFVVDRTVQEDNFFIEDYLHERNMAFSVKEGATISRMYEECGMDTDPQNNQE